MTILNCLTKLRVLRDEYSNEIPLEILHSNQGQPRYKVRKNWFQAIIAWSENLREEGLLSDDAIRQYETFMSYYETTQARTRPTTKEDINKANNLLETMIQELEFRRNL